jgi:RNA polymerase sigma factor (sigma-70 family)
LGLSEGQRFAVQTDLGRLFSAGTVIGLTDGELLERFTTRPGDGAEVAFAALVERHGPMVQRVCRRVLNNAHDADDAFQATFLVLVKRARTIRDRDSVASWLHGVAFRVASSARAAASRRHWHERKGAAMARDSRTGDDHHDLGAVLQAEITRLPERYRGAVVLCYLEGQTYEDAALHLRLPVGTVKSRLARARERLRRRLVRRGVVPSALAVGAALEGELAASPLSTALIDVTVRAAIRFAAGSTAAPGVVPASAAVLAEGVLKAMALAKWKSAVLSLVGVGMVTSGAIVLGQPDASPKRPEAELDRLSQVEQKLDRVLRALEGPEGSRDVRERPGALVRSRMPNPQADAPAPRGRVQVFERRAESRDATDPAARPPVEVVGRDGRLVTDRLEIHRLPPDGDRLSAVEKRLDELQRRIDAIERRLSREPGETSARFRAPLPPPRQGPPGEVSQLREPSPDAPPVPAPPPAPRPAQPPLDVPRDQGLQPPRTDSDPSQDQYRTSGGVSDRRSEPLPPVELPTEPVARHESGVADALPYFSAAVGASY